MPGSESLRTYVQQAPWKGGSSSWCCHAVPRELMAEVEAYVADCRATGRPVRWRAVVGWLIERGVEGATEARLAYHFERRHEERER